MVYVPGGGVLHFLFQKFIPDEIQRETERLVYSPWAKSRYLTCPPLAQGLVLSNHPNSFKGKSFVKTQYTKI